MCSLLTFSLIAQPLTVEFSNSPSRAVEQHVFFVNEAQTKLFPAAPVDLHNLGGKVAAALKSTTRNLNVTIYTENLPQNSAAHLAMGYQLRHYHFDQLKSDIADIKNSGVGNPGVSIDAAVLGTFVDEDLPWVHLDIAGVD